MPRQADRGQRRGDVVDEEIEVFEEPEHAEVRGDAQPEEPCAVPGRASIPRAAQ